MKKNMETKNHFMNDMTVLTNDLFIKGCKNEWYWPKWGSFEKGGRVNRAGGDPICHYDYCLIENS